MTSARFVLRACIVSVASSSCGSDGDRPSPSQTEVGADIASDTAPDDATLETSADTSADIVAETSDSASDAVDDGEVDASDVAPPPPPVRFAVIGDYGKDGPDEANVAKLVKSWKVDFVLTVGDNNYDLGGADTIDANIGKHYAEFVSPYAGAYGPGATTNRFWPALGNHDWNTGTAKPYTDYFALPGNERYYEKELGLVHVFVVDSDAREPDGATETSTQGKWLQSALSSSASCWDIVAFHHPAYNSGKFHGSTLTMRWPFKTWGADLVLQGHEHVYERLLVDGLTYITDGLGGNARYSFGTPLPESQVRYADDYGAVLGVATATGLTLEFWNVAGAKIDAVTIPKTCP